MLSLLCKNREKGLLLLSDSKVTYLSIIKKQILPIQNIIFDLGNVIIDIDPNRTANALNALAGDHLNAAQQTLTNDNFYYPYEMGKINDEILLDSLHQFAQKGISKQHIVDAWNAMLLQIPIARIELLKTLQPNYNLFVLSNTNNLHIQAFNQIVKDTCGLESIEPLMVKAYYSHETGFRKPMKEIFKLVIDEQRLIPNESLFIDDMLVNIETAQQCGLQTRHNPPGTCITSWLPEYLATFNS